MDDEQDGIVKTNTLCYSRIVLYLALLYQHFDQAPIEMGCQDRL